jgi:hypothetical protein
MRNTCCHVVGCMYLLPKHTWCLPAPGRLNQALVGWVIMQVAVQTARVVSAWHVLADANAGHDMATVVRGPACCGSLCQACAGLCLGLSWPALS